MPDIAYYIDYGMNFVSLRIFYIFHLYIVGLLGIYTNYLLLYYLLKYGNVQNELFTWSVGVSLFLHFSHYFLGAKKLNLTIFTWDWLAGLCTNVLTTLDGFKHVLNSC